MLNNTEHSISIKFKFTHNKHLKRYSMFALNQKCCFKSHSTNVAYVWFIKIKIKDGKSFCFQWWTKWNKGQEECLQTEYLCWCAFYVFCQNWSNKPKNELPIQLRHHSQTEDCRVSTAVFEHSMVNLLCSVSVSHQQETKPRMQSLVYPLNNIAYFLFAFYLGLPSVSLC